MTSLRNIGDPEPVDPRDAYLDAARACILDVGWRRTTLTEVARRAGVSRMTIYRSWADMPTLLGDLMTREWRAIAVEAADHPDPAHDAATQVADGVVAAVQRLRDNELFVRIVELDPELILPYLFGRRGRSQQAIVDLLVAQIALGQQAGTIRSGEPVVMARAITLAAHGFTLSAHTMVDEHADQADLDHELHALLVGTLRP